MTNTFISPTVGGNSRLYKRRIEMQHEIYGCHEEILSLKFDELIQKTTDNIIGRNLKSPKTRLNGLKSIKNLISRLIPDIEDNVSLIRDWEKNILISRLADLKGKKLNGAELSSLHHTDVIKPTKNYTGGVQKNINKTGQKLVNMANALDEDIKCQIGKKVSHEFEVRPNWFNTALEEQALTFLWKPTCSAYEAISGKKLNEVIMEYGPINLINNS